MLQLFLWRSLSDLGFGVHVHCGLSSLAHLDDTQMHWSLDWLCMFRRCDALAVFH